VRHIVDVNRRTQGIFSPVLIAQTTIYSCSLFVEESRDVNSKTTVALSQTCDASIYKESNKSNRQSVSRWGWMSTVNRLVFLNYQLLFCQHLRQAAVPVHVHQYIAPAYELFVDV
jgi:hypothetical protein